MNPDIYWMLSIYQPKWDTLRAILGASAERALICSPYITGSGVDRLFDALPGHCGLELITRLSPSDWAAGASDPEAIFALLALWDDVGNPTSLRIVQRLHAKVYAADDSRAIVGSPNLSEGGFDRNIELVVELSGDAARDAVKALNAACSSHTKEITIGRLKGWIDRSRNTVLTARAAAAGEPEEFSAVQADLDAMLGFGNSISPSLVQALPRLDSFVEWLDTRQALPGAIVILSRYRNSKGQNLTGHVKQCFFGAVRFLIENLDYVAPISDVLDQLSADDLFQMADPPDLRQAWADHLDAHALDQGESYSYSILRGILPPSLGGTRQGGGGGISTLKRLLPLVARYYKEGQLQAHHDDITE